jgi:hypothetical protein
MSDNESFFSSITENLNDNISSVCASLNNYKIEIKTELEQFNENINSKIGELYDIIEFKQGEINKLQTQLEEKTFEESNFNRVSILKTQDKEIKDLKNQLNIQIRRNTLLENKLKSKPIDENECKRCKNTQSNVIIKQEEPVVEEPEPVVEEPEPVVEEPEPVVEEPEPVVKKKEKAKKAKKGKKEKKEKNKEDKRDKKNEDKAKKDKKGKKEKKEKEKNDTEVLTDNEEKEIKEVVEEIIRDRDIGGDGVNTKTDFCKEEEDNEEDNVSLDNIDILEHKGVDYYLSEKNYIYEIANDEGDIGVRLGTFRGEVVSFY